MPDSGIIIDEKSNPFQKMNEESIVYPAESVDWSRIEHFEPAEFDDPKEPGSWRYMSALTILELNKIREKANVPIVTHNKFDIRGCVCVEPTGHSDDSLHYAKNGCSAVDWHFDTDADPRDQARLVLKSEFTGIGIYYDWKWVDGDGKRIKLSVGFHTDMRRMPKKPQIWRRVNGKYFYLLK